ncbi:molybdate ABC transporter substrate-binding protein [Sphaerimonospora cavernae]|uniref:Molybdate ABC transporter substrate-binding protein n=1 Tax=Sphaerimonospora cavernae TaxID=1740611 RepID=A0ABV6U8F5_9ACTN
MVRPRIGRRSLSASAILTILSMLCVTGCGGGQKDDTLTVFAAASLSESFSAIGKLFEQGHPDMKIRFSFGGSATLARQIKQGAPADVFAAANMETMRQSEAPTFRIFARNRLEIAVPKGNPAHVAGLSDLARPGVKVALCAPRVPCGAAAATALAAAGVTVKPVTQEQDVKAALTKVRLGEVDAGLVYRTDVRSAGGEVEGIEFAEADKAINDYPIAVVPGTRRQVAAKEFIDIVLSDQGRRVLSDAGFTLV